MKKIEEIKQTIQDTMAEALKHYINETPISVSRMFMSLQTWNDIWGFNQKIKIKYKCC
jgi:hypothetical protein